MTASTVAVILKQPLQLLNRNGNNGNMGANVALLPLLWPIYFAHRTMLLWSSLIYYPMISLPLNDVSAKFHDWFKFILYNLITNMI